MYHRHRSTRAHRAHRAARPVPAQALNQLTGSEAGPQGNPPRLTRADPASEGSNVMTGPAAPYGTTRTPPP